MNIRHARPRQVATGIAAAAAALLLMHTGTAEAHGQGHHQHKPGYGLYVDVHYRHGYQRSKRMPRWLRRHHHFKHWYWNSRVRYQRHLSWHDVYRIYQYRVSHHYRWKERRYRDRHYDRYERRYWHDDDDYEDRRYRDRRKGRRDRDDD